MTAAKRAALAALALGLGASLSARADLPAVSFTDEERAQLARGEPVVARREPSDGQGVAAQAAILLAATVDEVWPVIGDCPHFKEFMPRTVASEEKLHDATHSVCRVEISLPFPMHNLWSETDIHEVPLPRGGRRRTMDLLRGTYRKFHAAWDLLPQDGGERTLLVYRVDVEPDSAMPDALVSLGQRSSLPDTLRAVQKRVEEKKSLGH